MCSCDNHLVLISNIKVPGSHKSSGTFFNERKNDETFLYLAMAAHTGLRQLHKRDT